MVLAMTDMGSVYVIGSYLKARILAVRALMYCIDISKDFPTCHSLSKMDAFELDFND